jgi:hypothetical protein
MNVFVGSFAHSLGERKLLGRSVYVEDLDAKVAAAAGIDKGKILVVASTDRGRAAVAVFAETRPGPWRDEVITALRKELGQEPVLTIVCGQRGLIRRTSSGKPNAGTCGSCCSAAR